MDLVVTGAAADLVTAPSTGSQNEKVLEQCFAKVSNKKWDREMG